MKIISSYKVKIKYYNEIFADTVAIYRKAVSFFMQICDAEWTTLEPLSGKNRNNCMEALSIRTARNPNPKYDFRVDFYKFPSYLRRAAIQAALGSYASYKSNLVNWEKSNRQVRPPTPSLDRSVMPTLYKDNCYVKTGRNTASIKIHHKNDWVWLKTELREQDIKYIESHCKLCKELVPTLKKSGKQWYLVFPFEQEVVLQNKPIKDQVVCSVDLGVNNNAVCSAMLSDGTVVARKFINLAKEKDHLYKALGRVKKAQQNGNRKTPVKWKHVNDLNTDISRKTAKAVLDFALLHNADVLVFEYLDIRGRKRGSKKQRLHLWRKREIQKIAEHKAHKNGIRISRICAWGTSKLAFDGSGKVKRNDDNYSLCRFASGKEYNCDLSASYNIGARYYIREMLKSEPKMARLPDEAKVLRYGTGTTRTLSTLIRLNADFE